jgi:hypothetical protein
MHRSKTKLVTKGYNPQFTLTRFHIGAPLFNVLRLLKKTYKDKF